MRPLAASVLENEPLGAALFLLRLRAPEGARDCRPGQFLHLRCGPPGGVDPLLRRAFWVMGADEETLWLRYRVVGPGTRYLSRLRPGEPLDVLGPLGRPFELPPGARHLLLIGRGLDVAPLVALADLAVSRELEVALLAGFESAGQALSPHLVPAAAEFRLATDDGSAGHDGPVLDLAAQLLPWSDAVFVAGDVAGLAAQLQGTWKPVQVALSGWHGCATGVCLECVVHTKQGNRRACRDGPVFGWSELK